MIMKILPLLASVMLGALAAEAQTQVTLQECRDMALSHNKQLMMARQRISSARYQNKQAFAAYLPAIDFAGGYAYNQKDISIFDSDQLLPTKSFNPATQKYEFDLAKNPLTGEPIKDPATGRYVPQTVALIPKDAMTYDIHNVFFGAITITQPIYMGGKIVAMNKITKYAEEAAKALHNAEAENVIYAVDAAYWQVVSLNAKLKLARSYVNLLDTLDRNVGLMLEQGVATRSDKLSVDVKLNAARVDLAKVTNGLALSRMALAQVCGWPVDADLMLADEDKDLPMTALADVSGMSYEMAEVYDRRPDLQALRMSIQVAKQQQQVAMSSMLPNLALVGSYSFSNPNMFDGFKKRFSGAFSVGAMLTIPIWHWRGDYYKYKEARSEALVKQMQLLHAQELVSLQVSQASYRAEESVKTYNMATSNMAMANENLRSATLGFKEGVATVDNVMEAQTAWLKANSERIDAMIDVRLCGTYLAKALGRLR